MKKALPIILLIVMLVCLTSCDPETLGGFMGKMGQNFYGLKANMKDVNKATEKIDNSVTDNIPFSHIILALSSVISNLFVPGKSPVVVINTPVAPLGYSA